MAVHERDPKYLIKNGYLEKVENFEHKGKKIEASLLGYRITIKFVHHFFGRIFSNPDAVLTEDMLRPEIQDMETFVTSIENLSVTQKRVAEGYMTDGTYESLCPPLQALVSIMVEGNYKGMDRHNPEFREMFSRKAVLGSDWYKERLFIKQQRDISLWNKNIAYFEKFLKMKNFEEASERLDIPVKLKNAKNHLEDLKSAKYIKYLEGTLGADPLKPASGA